jgi:hypothetical protein
MDLCRHLPRKVYGGARWTLVPSFATRARPGPVRPIILHFPARPQRTGVTEEMRSEAERETSRAIRALPVAPRSGSPGLGIDPAACPSGKLVQAMRAPAIRTLQQPSALTLMRNT